MGACVFRELYCTGIEPEHGNPKAVVGQANCNMPQTLPADFPPDVPLRNEHMSEQTGTREFTVDGSRGHRSLHDAVEGVATDLR